MTNMKVLAAAVASVGVLADASPDRTGTSQPIEIARAGSQPSQPGPAAWFTGTVRIDPLFPVTPPWRTASSSVTFEPGARTAWHTHPLGQRLVVTTGVGRVQRWGGPVEEIRPGDVVWIPPGVKHWHGASPRTAMTHTCVSLAVQALGLAYAFEPAVMEHLRSGRLKLVLEEYAATVPGYSLYFPSRAQRSAPLRLFVEAAKELAVRSTLNQQTGR